MFLVGRSFAPINSGTRSHFGFNYDKQGRDWKVRCGERQSPIALWSCNSITCDVPKLKFLNYHKSLSDPLSVINNGLTVLMRIPKTVDGSRPSICISTEGQHVFEADQLHFHWGSALSKGSEHCLDGNYYDGEVHIVHKNASYKSNKEAGMQPNGFAVLALLIRNLEDPNIETPAMNMICKQVSSIAKLDDSCPLEDSMALQDLFVRLPLLPAPRQSSGLFSQLLSMSPKSCGSTFGN
ncbi:carbonic anhydrase 2 isoform X5 [Drosophila simulans]|uniref:carbonic anhydrase 2 isoform X5 n=1 Tax=Drosophila simulans TaxID=7240 RepID=UPI00078AF2B3|nr:carbonic anhydrase 2 isoform X5 [Drosophila simulans]KMZ05690.1 uncharacterized protein Dsimw501_GD18260, isoform D [Drosophila simulans]